MVRTLVANSEFAVCSRAPEAGEPTSAAVLTPLAAIWMGFGGGAAEFATSVGSFGGQGAIATAKASRQAHRRDRKRGMKLSCRSCLNMVERRLLL